MSMSEDSATDIPGEVIAHSADPVGFVPERDLFSSQPLSVNPSPALPEERKSSMNFDHHERSSEEPDSTEHSQISATLTFGDHVSGAFRDSLLGIISSPKTSPVEGNTTNTPDNEEEVKMAGSKDHNPSSITSVFESKGLEGSGSGSALDNIRLNQDHDEVATLWTYLSTLSSLTVNFVEDDTEENSGLSPAKLSTETDNNVARSKKVEIEKSEKSQEERGKGKSVNEGVGRVDEETDRSESEFKLTSGRETLKEEERTVKPETGSGTDTEFSWTVFGWTEDSSGSGEGGGDTGDARKDSNREVLFGRKDSVQPEAEFTQSDSSRENSGNTDNHDERNQSTSSDSAVVEGNATLSWEGDGGGKRNESEVLVEGEAKEESDAGGTCVGRPLFDAGRSLIPLLTLTDKDKPVEGKCYISSIFSQYNLSVSV